jgi:hypothetical protein
MKHITQNEINTSGTSLQGYVNNSYKELVSIFGEPLQIFDDGSKIDIEWRIEFEDGTISTIYNWKNGHNYLGDEGDDIDDMAFFNVGGKTKESVYAVEDALKN